MFTVLKRIIRSGWVSFRRQGYLTIATIFIMVMTISLITSLFLFHQISRVLISQLQEKVDISVYFKGEIFEKEILEVKEEIAKIPEVKNVEYVSRESALEEFTQRHKDNQALMESLKEVGKNPFAASLNIKTGQAAQYAAVAEFLEAAPFKNLIAKVDYYQRQPVIERIFSITSGISRAALLLSLVLAMVAVLVAFNQIRLAIYNQKEEISVQRLVGASNWFIRGPFLVQGAICGFFATLICLLILPPFLYFFGQKLEILLSGINIFSYFTANFFLILLIQLAVGLGLGIASSLIAIRKYLKV